MSRSRHDDDDDEDDDDGDDDDDDDDDVSGADGDDPMIIQLQLNHCLGHAARQSRIPRRLAPIPFSPRDGPHEGRSEGEKAPTHDGGRAQVFCTQLRVREGSAQS